MLSIFNLLWNKTFFVLASYNKRIHFKNMLLYNLISKINGFPGWVFFMCIFIECFDVEVNSQCSQEAGSTSSGFRFHLMPWTISLCSLSLEGLAAMCIHWSHVYWRVFFTFVFKRTLTWEEKNCSSGKIKWLMQLISYFNLWYQFKNH